jgi:hypothetical protein
VGMSVMMMMMMMIVCLFLLEDLSDDCNVEF